MRLLSPMITSSGWVYGVAAPPQKDGYVIGYPMYFPDLTGERIIKNRSYSKFRRGLPKDRPWIQLYEPEIHLDPWAVKIPLNQIDEVTDVVSAFQKWLTENDPRRNVIYRIIRDANIPISSIGLGGSTSLGCNQPDADIDILIYGSAHASSCIKAIENALLRGDAMLMSTNIATAYAQRYGKLYNLSTEYLFYIFAQDLTKIYVQGKKISFIFTYEKNEYTEIPQKLYKGDNYETTDIKARVVSNISSWYYPRKYIVQTIDSGLRSIWSHHWLHKAMAMPGTLVEILADKIDEQTLALTKLNHKIMPLHG